MRPPRPTARVAPLVLLAGVALAGCTGGDADTDPQAAPSASAASPSAEPSPTASGPDRSPEALAEQVDFRAPEFDDPVVQEAVAGYREFVTQLVVAQGLADGEYPPLVASVEPSYVDEALGNTRINTEAGGYLLGPFVETVVDGAGSEGQVFLTSCADVSERVVYLVADDSVARPAAANVVPANVTMIRAAEGWVLSGYVRNEELVCP
jgi:hypothetical protein